MLDDERQLESREHARNPVEPFGPEPHPTRRAGDRLDGRDPRGDAGSHRLERSLDEH